MNVIRIARNVLGTTALAWRRQGGGARGRQDAVVTARVLAALLVQPEVKSLDIFVETRDGEVKLKGFVSDESQRRNAVQTARLAAGTTAIRDELVKR